VSRAARSRQLLLVVGVVALLSVCPVLPVPVSSAAVPPTPPPPGPAAADEAAALALLGEAARAARTRSYTGTSFVGTWRGGSSTSAVVPVSHAPGASTDLRLVAGGAEGGGVVPVPAVTPDARLLGLLAAHYALDVVAPGSCAGRSAQVVEARRPDGRVAGRFWVDAASSLVLRREVYDETGARLRSSAFVDLSVVPDAPAARLAVPVAASAAPAALGGAAAVADDPTGPPADVAQLRAAGWAVPDALPGGFELYDARTPRHGGAEVLHLSYSDGLSTLSLFAQPGDVGDGPGDGFARQPFSGADVWVAEGSPERMVWQGGGRAYTVVSDGSATALPGIVGALPHDAAADTGALARVGRGLARIGSWVDPFS
jgi:MucB/RseB N-terminal domain